MGLDAIRRGYAEGIAATAQVRTPGLIEAFATVAREHYLGPGPWDILALRTPPHLPDYVETPSADPAHLYDDVCVAIDRARGLNNGQPSFLAACIDALDLGRDERVLHIGCGVGYYSAIMAHVVGPGGSVVAVEIDPQLAARARSNLADTRQVTVLNADGSALPADRYDAILLNAGVAELRLSWLESLGPAARMLVPMTTQLDLAPLASLGAGKMLKIVRTEEGLSARFVSGVAIYHCAGARDRDAEAALQHSLSRGDAERVRSLRIDRHAADTLCWLHGASYCLSTLEPGARDEG